MQILEFHKHILEEAPVSIEAQLTAGICWIPFFGASHGAPVSDVGIQGRGTYMHLHSHCAQERHLFWATGSVIHSALSLATQPRAGLLNSSFKGYFPVLCGRSSSWLHVFEFWIVQVLC